MSSLRKDRQTVPPPVPPVAPVRLDVHSDVACPWCFIGKRRIDRALAADREGAVEVRWRAFELQPDLPAAGVEAEPFFLAKFGGRAAMEAAFARVTEVGADDGIRFDFARMRRAPNTRLAHRVIALARRQGAADAAVEALFRGHFEEGADIADPDAVLALCVAHAVPLDRDGLRDALAAGEGADEVAADLRRAAEIGVRGVPFVVAGDAFAVSGAQSAETFRGLLEHARQAAQTEVEAASV